MRIYVSGYFTIEKYAVQGSIFFHEYTNLIYKSEKYSMNTLHSNRWEYKACDLNFEIQGGIEVRFLCIETFHTKNLNEFVSLFNFTFFLSKVLILIMQYFELKL